MSSTFIHFRRLSQTQAQHTLLLKMSRRSRRYLLSILDSPPPPFPIVFRITNSIMLPVCIMLLYTVAVASYRLKYMSPVVTGEDVWVGRRGWSWWRRREAKLRGGFWGRGKIVVIWPAQGAKPQDETWKEESKIKREKMQERQKRIDAGEVVSDTSSMKARKKEKKKAYLAKIRKQ